MKREPLPARPTNADLAKGQEDLHECLHAVDEKLDAHITDTANRLEAAREERQQIGEDVAAINAFVEPWREFFDRLAKARTRWSKRAVKFWLWLAATVLAAFVGSVVTLAIAAAVSALHNPSKAYIDAATANRYTAADAARDRVSQDARDKLILQQLSSLQATATSDHKTLVGTDQTANPRAHR